MKIVKRSLPKLLRLSGRADGQKQLLVYQKAIVGIRYRTFWLKRLY